MKRTRWLILTCVFFILFGGFTFALTKVDVQKVELGEHSYFLGFAGINQKVRDFLASNELVAKIPVDLADKISNLLLVASIGAAFVLFVVWLVQIFKYRSFTGLDCELYVFGLICILAIGAYIGFEKLAINYRPVLSTSGELEASYPSSHVLCTIALLGSAMLFLRGRLSSRAARGITLAVGILFMAIATLCRLLSGEHWASDIVGAVLLGVVLLMLYEALACNCARRVDTIRNNKD